jgi:hypothetical protein
VKFTVFWRYKWKKHSSLEILHMFKWPSQSSVRTEMTVTTVEPATKFCFWFTCVRKHNVCWTHLACPIRSPANAPPFKALRCRYVWSSYNSWAVPFSWTETSQKGKFQWVIRIFFKCIPHNPALAVMFFKPYTIANISSHYGPVYKTCLCAEYTVSTL